MSYQEKKTITTIITGVLLLTAYIIFLIRNLQARGAGLIDDAPFWAQAMLIFIGIGIAANIIIMIIFHIINAMVNEIRKQEQDDTSIEDEMDKLISLKATRNSFIVVGIGFVWALISLVARQPVVVMLNIIFLSFFLGSLFEGVSQLYFYRKGV
jgi:uncharacterized membrane protein